MGCRISHRQAHPPARTAAESDDIDVRFIAEAVRAGCPASSDRESERPIALRWCRTCLLDRDRRDGHPGADRIGVGPAMYHFDQGLFGEIGLSTPVGSAKAAALEPISPRARPRG